MLPVLTRAITGFQKNIPEPFHVELKDNYKDDLANEVNRIEGVKAYYERTADHGFTQPGEPPKYWFKLRDPEDTGFIDITGLSVNDWRLDTRIDPYESEVWIENQSSHNFTRIYGVNETNIWRFIEEAWSLGNTIRICDGMLLSVLHQCLYNLKNTDAVTTMEWTDYDEEAEQHSDKAYGSLSNKRRTIGDSKNKKPKADKHKKTSLDASFYWQEPFIRKYQSTTFFPYLTTEAVVKLDQSLLEEPPRKYHKLNKNREAFLKQRLQTARRYKNESKQLPKSSKPEGNTSLSVSYKSGYTTTNTQLTSTLTTKTAAGNGRAKKSPQGEIHQHGSSMSASMRGEEVRIRGLDMLESHIPHFYTDRTDEISDYDNWAPWRTMYEDIMTQVSNSLENKEGTTLTEEVKYRDLVRRAGSLNKTLGEIRFDVRKKGIQLHELLKVQADQLHPSYPPKRNKETTSKKSIATNPLLLPTQAECRTAQRRADSIPAAVIPETSSINNENIAKRLPKPIDVCKIHTPTYHQKQNDDNIQAVVDTESLKVMDGGSIQPPPTTVAAEDGDDDDENPDKPKAHQKPKYSTPIPSIKEPANHDLQKASTDVHQGSHCTIENMPAIFQRDYKMKRDKTSIIIDKILLWELCKLRQECSDDKNHRASPSRGSSYETIRDPIKSNSSYQSEHDYSTLRVKSPAQLKQEQLRWTQSAKKLLKNSAQKFPTMKQLKLFNKTPNNDISAANRKTSKANSVCRSKTGRHNTDNGSDYYNCSNPYEQLQGETTRSPSRNPSSDQSSNINPFNSPAKTVGRSFSRHLPPIRVKSRGECIASDQQRDEDKKHINKVNEGSENTAYMTNHKDASCFNCRWSHKHKDQLLELLHKYRVTHERMICNRGYSLTCITIHQEYS